MKINSLVQNKVQMGGGYLNSINNYSFHVQLNGYNNSTHFFVSLKKKGMI